MGHVGRARGGEVVCGEEGNRSPPTENKQARTNSKDNKTFQGKVAVLRGWDNMVCSGSKKFRAFILQLSVWWQRVGADLEKVS